MLSQEPGPSCHTSIQAHHWGRRAQDTISGPKLLWKCPSELAQGSTPAEPGKNLHRQSSTPDWRITEAPEAGPTSTAIPRPPKKVIPLGKQRLATVRGLVAQAKFDEFVRSSWDNTRCHSRAHELISTYTQKASSLRAFAHAAPSTPLSSFPG